ncbi:MAG: hypothetical protein RL329_2619, partial [Bacteroidota bacterium]
QTYKTTNIHILEIDETTIPAHFLPILRKLQGAIVEKQIRDTMLLEDEIIEELEDKERDLEEAIEDLTQEYEQKLEEKDKVLEEKDKILEEKDRILAEQQRYIEALMQQLNQKK